MKVQVFSPEGVRLTSRGMLLLAARERAAGNPVAADRMEHQARKRAGDAQARLGRWIKDGRSHGFWIGSTRVGWINLSPRKIGHPTSYAWRAGGRKGTESDLRSARRAVIASIRGTRPHGE